MSSSSETFVLVEGVNILETLFDTDQLSVIRGGSFLFKNAIDYVTDKFSDELKPLSTGASSGLFLLQPSCDADALVQLIQKNLQAHQQFQHLTLLVVAATADSLLQAKEKLFANIRFLQLQSLSQVPDQIPSDVAIPCGLEGIRMCSGKRQLLVKNVLRPVSESVFARREYGREQRKSYYGNILDDEGIAKLSFTDDFETLASCDDFPHLNQQLNNKVAVIYIDGNGFGALQRRAIQAAEKTGGSTAALEAQIDFDRKIGHFHKQFLAYILNELQDNERFPEAINQQGQLCFETLLWGGDEMLFVMPARFGFNFIQAFFQQAAEWFIDIPGEQGDAQHVALTYSAGVVFCHAKTPIRITRDLARSMLADRMKASMKETGEALQNAWDYLVLESIDYPVNADFEHFITTRYGHTLSASRPALIPPCLTWGKQDAQDTIQASMRSLLHDKLLPNSRLYQIASEIVASHNSPETSLADVSAAIERLYTLAGSDADALKAALQDCAALFALDYTLPKQQAWMWLHLFELRDYILPQHDSIAETAVPAQQVAQA